MQRLPFEKMSLSSALIGLQSLHIYLYSQSLHTFILSFDMLQNSGIMYFSKSSSKELFLMLYSLLTNSQFKFLFGKNLQQLKNYFFVFERLLHIYLPSVYYYFAKHSVSVHYYMTPWLITLFTNVIQYNKNEIPLIVLNIWDEFLIKGWKALFTSIIALISIHIEEIESKNGDMLLSFLINDLSKSEKFSDENYSKWIEEKKKFKIKNKDITNIEGEIKYEYNDNKTIDYLFNKN